ncbi:MAG: hypothetical protein IT445_02155 [Phycisphaeraceae bacterium]|nr:hypothetical protein [Phycisphaeraceae bacterium]
MTKAIKPASVNPAGSATAPGVPAVPRIQMRNYPTARQHFIDWWNQRGMVLWITAPADKPWIDAPAPPPPRNMQERWFGPEYRAARFIYDLSRLCFVGDAFPMAVAVAGAGDLAAYLGCPIELTDRTVWFHPAINEPPEDHPPLKLDPQSPVLGQTIAMLERVSQVSASRFMLTMPDIVENIDILASLRGTEKLLIDMIDRPQWVVERVEQINQIYFEVFDLLRPYVQDAEGGNAFCFNVWGPGRTAKVQCDACSMFGPSMFKRFVVPALTEQCRWLDYAMYHLDGEQALPNLDLLLEIEPLRAIEWTPVLYSLGEGGGHPKWYDLYRRILKAGKSVQAIRVQHDQVIPLLDAVGSRGMYIWASAPDEQTAREIAEKAESYR